MVMKKAQMAIDRKIVIGLILALIVGVLLFLIVNNKILPMLK